ncbi:MAG: hypothetical protein IKL65_00985 [Bacilli bacterium]|nr:hypothetical protein [Bacilli bacterium]
MRRGSFNKIYKIGNFVIKLDANKDSFSNLIIKEMDFKKYIKYQKDLNKCGIKTSKIYFYTTFPKTILIEKNIEGYNLQEIMSNQEVDIKEKLKLIKKLLLIYKKVQNCNVCVDCNLKNFILNNNELIYIDFVPSLYKDKIKQVNNAKINDYKKLYIDENIQLLSIMNYILKSLLYLPRDQLKEIKNEIIINIEKIFKIKINLDEENIVTKKAKLLNKFISESITKEEFDLEYKKINKR